MQKKTELEQNMKNFEKRKIKMSDQEKINEAIKIERHVIEESIEKQKNSAMNCAACVVTFAALVSHKKSKKTLNSSHIKIKK